MLRDNITYQSILATAQTHFCILFNTWLCPHKAASIYFRSPRWRHQSNGECRHVSPLIERLERVSFFIRHMSWLGGILEVNYVLLNLSKQDHIDLEDQSHWEVNIFLRDFQLSSRSRQGGPPRSTEPSSSFINCLLGDRTSAGHKPISCSLEGVRSEERSSW